MGFWPSRLWRSHGAQGVADLFHFTLSTSVSPQRRGTVPGFPFEEPPHLHARSMKLSRWCVCSHTPSWGGHRSVLSHQQTPLPSALVAALETGRWESAWKGRAGGSWEPPVPSWEGLPGKRAQAQTGRGGAVGHSGSENRSLLRRPSSLGP